MDLTMVFPTDYGNHVRSYPGALHFGELLRTPLDLGVWALLEPAGRQNHAPQLHWIDANTLACVWMAGDREGTSGMSVFGSTLTQGQGAWTAPKRLSQDSLRSEQNPLLYRTHDGLLHLVHTAQEPRIQGDASWQQQESSFSMQWTAVLRHQQTLAWDRPWSAASDLIDEPLFCRNPPLVVDDQSILLPVYRSLEAGGAFGHDHSFVLVLQAGANAGSGYLVPVPESVGRVHGSIVYSADRKCLLQFFRSRLADCVYRSVGQADGLHWSAPEPVDLPNNNSSIQALRLQCGLLALVFNRIGSGTPSQRHWGEAVWPRERWPLSIAVSADDGNSWPWIRDIDRGDGYCGMANWHLNRQLAYPTLVEGAPGELHLAYSWADRSAIRYVSLMIGDVVGAS